MTVRLLIKQFFFIFCTLIIMLFSFSSYVKAENSQQLKEQLDAYHVLKDLFIENLNQTREHNTATLRRIICENESVYEKISHNNESTLTKTLRENDRTLKEIISANDTTYNKISSDNDRTLAWLGIIIGVVGVAFGVVSPLLSLRRFDKRIDDHNKRIDDHISKNEENMQTQNDRLSRSEDDINKKLETLQQYMASSKEEMQNQLDEYKGILDAMKEQKIAVDTKVDEVQLIELKSKLMEIQDLHKRIEEITKFLSTGEKNDELLTMRGIAKRDLKQYEEAVEDFRKALSFNKNNVIAYSNINEIESKFNLSKNKTKVRPIKKPRH